MKNKKSTSQRKSIKKQPTKKVSKKQSPKNQKVKLAIRVIEYERKVFKKYINNKKIKKSIKKQAPIKNLSKRKVRIVKGYSNRGQKFTAKFYKINSLKEYEKVFNTLKKNKKNGSNLTIVTFEYTGKIDLNKGMVTGQKCVTRKLIKKRKNKKDKLNDSIVSNFIEMAENLSFLNEQYELELEGLDYLIEQ